MILKLSICDIDVIMTKNVYDPLKNKPPLRSSNKSDTGLDRSTFKFDEILYLNIKFPESNLVETGTLEYEPVLVSSRINASICGAQTEIRFRNCNRDLETYTPDYVTKDSRISYRTMFL